MTRSVEIPEEAVEAAAKAIYESPQDGLSREGYEKGGRDIQNIYRAEARAALGAALPYLAPAGDGGLREALEKIKQAKRRLWAGLMAVKPKLDEPYPDDARWTPWTRFVGPRLDDLLAALDALLLAAHPAAPAVPQPVDREALADAIQRVVYGTVAELSGEREVCGEAADAVLAALTSDSDDQRHTCPPY